MGATLQDWLRLHGIGVKDCLVWLDRLGPEAAAAGPAVSDPALALDREEAWVLVTDVVARALDEAGLSIRLCGLGHDFTDGRALTLRAGADGRPYLRLRWTGCLSDLLVMGHEAGHAAQYALQDSAAAELPPILREAAAIRAEMLVAEALQPRWPGLAALSGQRRHRQAGRRAIALRKVLRGAGALGTAYDYGWNYPLARALAESGAATESLMRGAAGLDPRD